MTETCLFCDESATATASFENRFTGNSADVFVCGDHYADERTMDCDVCGYMGDYELPIETEGDAEESPAPLELCEEHFHPAMDLLEEADA